MRNRETKLDWRNLINQGLQTGIYSKEKTKLKRKTQNRDSREIQRIQKNTIRETLTGKVL